MTDYPLPDYIPPGVIDVEVTTLVRNEGTIVVFRGVEVETGDTVTFAADHGPAGDLCEALYEQVIGIVDTWPIVAEVPSWAVLSRSERA